MSSYTSPSDDMRQTTQASLRSALLVHSASSITPAYHGHVPCLSPKPGHCRVRPKRCRQYLSLTRPGIQPQYRARVAQSLTHGQAVAPVPLQPALRVLGSVLVAAVHSPG